MSEKNLAEIGREAFIKAGNLTDSCFDNLPEWQKVCWQAAADAIDASLQAEIAQLRHDLGNERVAAGFVIVTRDENKRLEKERDALAQAIGEAVVKMGVAQAVPMTGPELIHMLDSAAGVTPCTYPDCLSARAVRAAGDSYQRGYAEGLEKAAEIVTDVIGAVSKSDFHATWANTLAGAIHAAAPVTEARPTLAKCQPCGCVICTCADEKRCHGCGARHCGTHPVGEIPNPLYEEGAAAEVCEYTAKSGAWSSSCGRWPIPLGQRQTECPHCGKPVKIKEG